MRKILFFLFILLSISIFADTKEGSGIGYRDEIKVTVETDKEKITAIKVIQSNETKRIGQPAIAKLTVEILQKQSTDVDNVAGATYTSEGFKEAVKNALKK